jgi:nitrate reductase beta subunit
MRMRYWDDRVELSTLVGKTLAEVRRSTDEIVFVTDTGETFKMYHEQSCCESVYIEDVEGDLESLVGNPILIAEEVSNADLPKVSEYDESFTWTFYKLATIKGHVDIRWYGSSNGYYSESVDFVKVSA